MNADQIFGQARPLLSLIGSALIVLGLAKFCGLNVPISAAWWEVAISGWFCKQI